MTVQFFETLHILGRSIGRGPNHRKRVTVFEVMSGHGSAQFRAKSGRWVLTIKTDQFRCSICGEEAAKYLQFMALEDGVSVIGECVSNQFLDDHHKFAPDQESALRLLGWEEPNAPQVPNWFFEAISNVELVALDELTNRTLREVFALHDRDVVEVSFYEMAVGAPKCALPESAGC